MMTMRDESKRARRMLYFGLLAAAMLWVVAGCGRGGADLPEGCSIDDAVPGAVRAAVEQAAARYYDHARKGEGKEIFEEAAALVRERNSPDQFLAPIARVAREIGFPPLTTRSIATVRFGETTPYQSRLDCSAPGSDAVTTFLLPDVPVQASLIQVGQAAGETFYYSTVWFREPDGAWRLGAIFTKPATIFGKGTAEYAEEAAAQRSEGHLRNAALLYNVAIDLAVPAAWIKPAAVDELQRQQRRITVDRLPSDRLDPWAAEPDTFAVYSVGYAVFGDALGVAIRYESKGAVSDTLSQKAYGDRLMRYVSAEFPEYREVFRHVALEAHERGDKTKVWRHSYPLESAP
jgi:hypothetical protein